MIFHAHKSVSKFGSKSPLQNVVENATLETQPSINFFL